MMKSVFAGLIVLSSLTMPSLAQQNEGPSGIALGETPDRARGETCVEVEIGGQRSPSLDCLNRQLKRVVERVQPVGNIPPVSASSPSVQVGGFDETAMSQQFGQNWGKSVIPFRPAAPVYGTPLR